MTRVAPNFCMSGFQYSSSRDCEENPVAPAILPSQHPVCGQECRMIEKGNNHREFVHGIGAIPRVGIVSKAGHLRDDNHSEQRKFGYEKEISYVYGFF